MRFHARSEKIRKILRRNHRQGNEEEEGVGAAEIGSRVFPFRTPPPAAASMPTVGTRRSTRVFVPKQQRSPSASGVDVDPAVILRSGKRIAHDGSEWLKVLGRVDGSDLKRWWRPDKVEVVKPVEEKRYFGIVYSRKRRRSTVNEGKDRKFGIVFERKHRKKEPKLAPLVERVTNESQIVREFCVGQCSRGILEKLGILEGDVWRGPECGSVVLAVVVDSSVGNSSERFGRLLSSVMTSMRRAGVDLMHFVAFCMSRPISSVFSTNGIHLLPMRQHKIRVLDSVLGYGLCKMYGARGFLPMLSVNYSALPSYFKLLHACVIHGSQYLPSILRSEHLAPVAENSLVVVPCEEHAYTDMPLEMDFSCTDFTVESPCVKWDDFPTLGDSLLPDQQNSVIINGSTLRKHQRKRSSLMNSRARNLSFKSQRLASLRSSQNGSIPANGKRGFSIAPICVKPVDSCLTDLFNGREESDASSSPGSCSKLRKVSGMKNPLEKIKEHRLAMAEVRQNIDSACCNANILVNDAEKCWREDGAQVKLESSGSGEWFIAVKRADATRFLHKPQDLRPCVVNRFTHVYMWSGDDGWKLEFCDKWDWYVFKELHSECRDRNAQDASLKAIPVPGVREVDFYEDDASPSFVRPDIYIHVLNDEVGRALASEISYYDMDSADEEWLRNLNLSLLAVQNGGSSYISEENFERIIFSLEKDAFSCPDDPSDKGKALDHCQELGTREVVSAIYDYWLKKRKQKNAPLVRVFQGPPLRRTKLIQKPFLRKRRSFKRQRSQAERNQIEWNQTGRGKPDLFMQAHQEAIRKVQEAEAAANRAAEVAIQLRIRAQMLMSNADLAAYKAAMALRIAETIRVSSSESRDLDSSILFD